MENENCRTEPEFVILESPYAGDVDANVEYAQKAMRDSLMRGEAPLASHLLYTEALDDTVPHERNMGIEAGLAIGKFATRTVVYTDRGISGGMKYGIERATSEDRPIEYRSIEDIVHNHGPSEGRGLDCGETEVYGQKKGWCLLGHIEPRGHTTTS